MATVVTQVHQLHDDPSALARKRRREIRLSQRIGNQSTTTTSQIAFPDMAVSTSEPATKKPRNESSSTTISTVKPSPTTVIIMTTAKKKKPQMKYDPDVPMTKEEAAIWRREQRRKRNRESAAASRQRQRDRIAELEVELDDWKTKYEEILRKISAAEEITKMKVTDDLIDSLPTVSPISPITNLACISSSSTGKVPDTEATVVSDTESEKEHNNKMISRQASSRITT